MKSIPAIQPHSETTVGANQRVRLPRTRRLALTLVIIATLLYTACGPTSTEPIKIGAIYNLQGAQASLDIPSANGVKLAVKELNSASGISGRRIDLILYDGKTDPGTIEKAARDLVEKDKVTAIIGFSDTDQVLYAAPIAAAAGVVFLTSGATSPKLPLQVPSFLFLVAFSDDAQAEAAADYAYKDLKLKTAYLLVDRQMEYTVILGDHFKAGFEASGGKVVLEDKYTSGDRDFSTQINRLKQLGAMPDMLYVAAGPDDAGAIVKQFRQAGFSQPIFGGDAYDTPLLAETAGPGADNVYFTTHALLDEKSGSGLVRSFVAAYKNEYGAPPENAFAALGYDTVMLLANAIRKGRGESPRSILVGLVLTKDFEVVTGNISYDNGSRIPRKDVTIIALQKGQRTFAAQVTPPQKPSNFFPQHVH